MTRTVTAKYPGRCAKCGCYHIAPGDTIISRPDGTWYKQFCNRPDIRSKKKHDAQTNRALANGEYDYNRPSDIDAKITAELAYFTFHPIDNSSWAGVEVFF